MTWLLLAPWISTGSALAVTAGFIGVNRLIQLAYRLKGAR